MLFQVKEIVLWPRRTGLAPRRVSFLPGKLNVITGASRTGKSAVIPIIDYCLGSRSCTIPVQTIRNACSWFGVVVQTADGEKLFARKEPGAQRSTEEMYFSEGATVEIPGDIPVKNTNAETVRRSLDELSGLTNLDFGGGAQLSGFLGRPSFRDLAAFIFQPQNVIANPDILFFKADTQEHREKLRTIFPYILGAVTPEMLAKQHELRRLERELSRKERELKAAQEVSAEWVAELRSKVEEAREFGLVGDALPAQLSRDEMLDILRRVVASTDRTIQVSTTTISEALMELSDLEKEEATVSRELTAMRRRLSEMKRLRESAASYHEALVIQRDRLKVADWLMDLHTGTEGCPVCGNHLERPVDKLTELHTALKQIEETAGTTREIPASFEREYQRVQETFSIESERLRAVQIRREALTRRSAEAEQQQFQAKRLERFVGNLESDIRTFERIGTDSALLAEVTSLREEVDALRAEIAESEVKRRLERALRIVNSNAGRLLPSLDVERPTDPVSLDINNLTVRVTSTMREDYLWEIGSGSNWLSYHLATMLGLHGFFLTQRHSPVPGLLLLDQPSQVYFPKLLVSRGDSAEEPEFKDEDIEAVRKAFTVLSNAVSEANGRLQVIVLDHAPESVWAGLPNATLVEEWRGGKKLVPDEWLA